TKNWGSLELFDFRQAAFPARFYGRCLGPDKQLCECGSTTGSKSGCILLSNVREVERPRSREVAPLRYLPFDDRAEAERFQRIVNSGHTRTYFLVERDDSVSLGSPSRQWNANVYGHLRARVKKLLFVDDEGRVVKSFIVPEKPVASDGLPLDLQAAQSK